jgi:hypothetical protein
MIGTVFGDLIVYFIYQPSFALISPLEYDFHKFASRIQE